MFRALPTPPVSIEVQGFPNSRSVCRWVLAADAVVLVPPHVGEVCHLIHQFPVLHATRVEPGNREKVMRFARSARACRWGVEKVLKQLIREESARAENDLRGAEGERGW